MRDLLSEERFGFITQPDKEFIIAFDEKLSQYGYDCGDGFRDGFCWGKYMLVYTKTGVKSPKAYCRIYIRSEGVAVRLYLSGVEGHRAYIESAPQHIRDAFVNDYGLCGHCHNARDGTCKHRKTYTINERQYEKCDGYTFEFREPDSGRIPDYIGLLAEFYPVKKAALKQ